MEFRVGLAGEPPVAHIAVVRAIDLADGFLFNGNALHGLDGDDCGHTDAVTSRNSLAQGGAVYIVIHHIGNVLLINALDG